jgi:ABC-2 type transport system permease protein
VTSLEHAAQPAGWAEPGARGRVSAGLQFAYDVVTVTDSELRKLRHDPYEMVTRAAQPVLWLLIFGQVLSATRAIPTGGLRYLDFLAPGVLAQSALFASIFFGMASIWERDLGVIHSYLVAPVARVALVTGKAISAGLRSLSQALVVYVLAGLLGVNVRLEPVALVVVAVIIIVGSGMFATFSLIIAATVRSRERFMGIGQILTMPFFFASSAVYPISIMPDWLKVVATVNPLTYMVDGLRQTMVVGGTGTNPIWLDLGILAVALVLLLSVATRLYPRLAQ